MLLSCVITISVDFCRLALWSYGLKNGYRLNIVAKIAIFKPNSTLLIQKIKVGLAANLYSLTHIVLNVEFDMSKNDIIMKKL